MKVKNDHRSEFSNLSADFLFMIRKDAIFVIVPTLILRARSFGINPE